ncbi:MAG: hypothetical protein HY657_12120 [Acidobacteria bacterium]|nr:hypothetical protein [Acidobacteriota bacterium]
MEILIEAPNRFRRNEQLELFRGALILRTEALDGDEAWDDSSTRGAGDARIVIQAGPRGAGADPARLREAQLRARRADLARYLLAWLLRSDAPAAHVGAARAPDGAADVLEFTPADGSPLRLFVDSATRLPLMISWQGAAPLVAVRGRGPGAATPDEATPQPRTAAFEMRLCRSTSSPIPG